MLDAIASDKAVKRARVALDDARAALDAQREEERAARAHLADVEAEIDRVTRVGDTKADVLGLHGDRAHAHGAISDAAKVMEPLVSAVRIQEQALARAQRAAIQKLMGDLRGRARVEEDRAVAAIDEFEAALDAIVGLHRERAQLSAAWNAAGGNPNDGTVDLLSLEPSEIARDLRMNHGPIERIRYKFTQVFSRGGRPRRPAA